MGFTFASCGTWAPRLWLGTGSFGSWLVRRPCASRLHQSSLGNLWGREDQAFRVASGGCRGGFCSWPPILCTWSVLHRILGCWLLGAVAFFARAWCCAVPAMVASKFRVQTRPWWRVVVLARCGLCSPLFCVGLSLSSSPPLSRWLPCSCGAWPSVCLSPPMCPHLCRSCLLKSESRSCAAQKTSEIRCERASPHSLCWCTLAKA